MKNIKLKSLLKEISILGEGTKHTELKELEAILLKAGYKHVKDDAGFSGKATYEKSGEEISLFKDYEEDMGPDRGKTFPVRVLQLAGTKTLADKNYDSIDKAKVELEKMISQDSLKETNIKMVDQGYAQDFYKIKSDVVNTWTDTNTIEADIEGYLELAHESGGPKLVREVMNAIVAGVNNAKPLLRQLKGTSPADVDLAETKSTKLTSLVKEGRGTGPISKLVRDKYGDDVLNAVYELEETLLGIGTFRNEMTNIADIVFEILDAAYDEGYYDGQTEM